jgi:hypothetical protein
LEQKNFSLELDFSAHPISYFCRAVIRATRRFQEESLPAFQ